MSASHIGDYRLVTLHHGIYIYNGDSLIGCIGCLQYFILEYFLYV